MEIRMEVRYVIAYTKNLNARSPGRICSKTCTSSKKTSSSRESIWFILSSSSWCTWSSTVVSTISLSSTDRIELCSGPWKGSVNKLIRPPAKQPYRMGPWYSDRLADTMDTLGFQEWNILPIADKQNQWDVHLARSIASLTGGPYYIHTINQMVTHLMLQNEKSKPRGLNPLKHDCCPSCGSRIVNCGQCQSFLEWISTF